MTAEEKAAHSALLLLNVAASWVSHHLVPKVLAQRLEGARQEVAAGHPWVGRFRVDTETGRVAFDTPALPRGDEIPALARAVAAWLRAFFQRVERAVPGRYDLERLSVLTGAHRRELAEQGFAAALGWRMDAEAFADPVSAPDVYPGSPKAPLEPSTPTASEEAL